MLAARRADEVEVLTHAQLDSQLVEHGPGHGRRVPEQLVRVHEGEVADEDCRAVTEAAVLAPPGHCVVAVEEGPMHGRQPTAQRRAVHDVVVHQGERVQQLERGAGVDHDLVGRVAPGTHEGPVTERGPQPLAAGADEVEQGSQRCVEVGVDPGPAVDLPADQVVDAPFDRVADLGQARGGLGQHPRSTPLSIGRS